MAERDRLIELNDRLRLLLRKAQGFEAKSERLAKLHPDQLNLALEDLEQAIAEAEASQRRPRSQIHRGNGESIAARCPPICRASTRRLRQPTRVAPVARSRCMRSARRPPSGST